MLSGLFGSCLAAIKRCNDNVNVCSVPKKDNIFSHTMFHLWHMNTTFFLVPRQIFLIHSRYDLFKAIKTDNGMHRILFVG